MEIGIRYYGWKIELDVIVKWKSELDIIVRRKHNYMLLLEENRIRCYCWKKTELDVIVRWK